MANKGLCTAVEFDGTIFYQGARFAIGILEFQPVLNPEACISCGTCIDRCPSTARTMKDEDKPEVDFDRCFGCAVCVTGCPEGAILMETKPGYPESPTDGKALREAIKAATN